MIPKNHKQFIESTSEKTGHNKILVSDVVGFYYSEVRKALNEMESVNIKVHCLGTFKVKEKQLIKLKLRLKGHLDALQDPETFNQMRIKKEVEERYDKVEKLSGMLMSEKIRKRIHREERNGKTEGNLEE